ncbi:alpha/beta hydrolase [Streptomyces sp. DH41]|uniref:alpha/beta hydrolase n=1 Tax=Streptomyces sp. DH41 TaxID=3040125 RepID=UPI002442F171|nr:alpha/beta hydrolase [Streptomyces sp. DH41]MDG9722617.1 alpha/beta hydrolase [Streptomyces sp. DH41]
MDPATAAVSVALSAEGEELFELFRRPQGRSRPRPDERAAIESARTGELCSGGRAVVTYRWGDGRNPVLLVHGWESRASRYAKIIDRLVALGCSPVAFDAPGHGESEGDGTTLVEYRDIILALHRAHGGFVTAVGHSFGALAMSLALRQGLRADRVVAVSPVPDFAYLVDVFCQARGLSPHLTREVRTRIECDLYPGEPDMWTRFSVLDGATEDCAPLLVVHDEDDEAVDSARAERIVEALGARARLLTTRRYGHRRILGAPQVVEEIALFAAGARVVAGRGAGPDAEVAAG